MRYVYGITAALLARRRRRHADASGPVGAQTAQNEPGAIAAAAPRAGAPMSFADLAARLQPAVVNISTKQTHPGQPQPPAAAGLRGFLPPLRRAGAGRQAAATRPVTQRGGSLGSGFIISADGYVVTNNHVVSPARTGATVEQITVTLSDRREYRGEAGRPRHRVRPRLAQDQGATACPSSASAIPTRTRVGDWVVAIGNPFGLGGTVTAGIVSALHRNIGAGAYDRYIQTDASINFGQ